MDVNQKLLTALTIGVLGYTVIKKIKFNQRRWWMKPWLSKRDEGSGRGILAMVQNELKVDDKEGYKNFLRMTEENFLKLLDIVQERIERRDTHLRQCISAEKRLSVTLRFLATGESFKSLSFSTRIAQNTISKIIPEVLAAIVETMRDIYLRVPLSQEEWQRVANDFYAHWNFPNCLGALDGKHIVFRPPRSSGSFYRNYKGTDSIVLLALVDANYKFLYIDIGTNGRISDGGVFSRSDISSAIFNNSLHFPSKRPLPGRQLNVPFVIVADDAFPLKERIMKPFRYRGLTNEQKIFNYRLSRARRVVENAFGILSNRFRVLLHPMNLCVEKVELVTMACCILHNFLIHEGNQNYVRISDGNRCAILPPITRQSGNRVAQTATAIRAEFQNYFNTSGKVDWQQNSVNRHQM